MLNPTKIKNRNLSSAGIYNIRLDKGFKKMQTLLIVSISKNGENQNVIKDYKKK